MIAFSHHNGYSISCLNDYPHENVLKLLRYENGKIEIKRFQSLFTSLDVNETIRVILMEIKNNINETLSLFGVRPEILENLKKRDNHSSRLWIFHVLHDVSTI